MDSFKKLRKLFKLNNRKILINSKIILMLQYIKFKKNWMKPIKMELKNKAIQ